MNKTKISLQKKMRNRRFRKTEEKILKVFFVENKKGSTMKKIAREAGVGRSTMYTHHHAVRDILPDYEKYLLDEYRSAVRKHLRRKEILPRILYTDMLIFILRNKKFFELFLKCGNRVVVNGMIEIIKKPLFCQMKLPNGADKIFDIYQSEVTEVLMIWGKDGYSIDEMKKTIEDILYLTDTAKARLTPIER